MLYSDYLIKNCSTKDFEAACPKYWSKLKPAFSDIVRHCDHCNKKVYLCETDEQIKFYSSVKFCIAVAQKEEPRNVERNTPSSPASIPNTIAPATQHDNGLMVSIDRPVPNVWRKSLPFERRDEIQHGDIAVSLRKLQVTDDSDIPAFLRKRSI